VGKFNQSLKEGGRSLTLVPPSVTPLAYWIMGIPQSVQAGFMLLNKKVMFGHRGCNMFLFGFVSAHEPDRSRRRSGHLQ
jgi:hypothetical protein